MSPAYEQTSSYIPATDLEFKAWLLNFSNLITADPGKYGLDTADAVIIADHYNAFATAVDAAIAPSTRTPTIIAQKDAQRAAAAASVRVYAQMIKANGAIDNEDKLALGLHVNDPTPTPIPEPTTAPLLMITGAFSGTHEVRYADEMTPASRKKPAGAIQLLLYMTVADGAATNPEEATFVGPYTKNPVQVEHEPENSGKTATYFARWVTRTGKMGPWSLPEAMTIAFGGPVEVGAALPTGDGTTQTTEGSGGEDIKIAA